MPPSPRAFEKPPMRQVTISNTRTSSTLGAFAEVTRTFLPLLETVTKLDLDPNRRNGLRCQLGIIKQQVEEALTQIKPA